MAKVIAVANQKGGVGKTTTCVNLCAAITKRGRRVLLVDCDPQGNSTSGMGVSKDAMPNVYDVLVRGENAADCVIKTEFGFVLPANKELSGATIELVKAEDREFVLKNALLPVKSEYDYIFIDCPPSLEILTVNALAAADSVLIPVQCEYYALEGIADLMTTVKLTKRRVNPALEVQGIVLTMYDSRTNFSEQVAAEVERFFGNAVYKTRIPRNIRTAEAPSHGVPVIRYDKLSKGSRAYLHLAGEFIKREE
ncbi:MAG: ParA family protein [Clostridia bacterium]|nr:ParA family protein [Clostridia bacterium]